ncbi:MULTISPECIES: LacI family DNA-binding transcriptional regulator [Brachybacterium]|uniref:LacI family transcriptional regulator n=1 Tax=Brachybacterium alimentarium TaxID=47845 RepID=A0A2A3YGX7_9MICO|nr:MULTISPECIES: LacI family DNA-binding transcriptional regulator [Brachybacterium]PCC30842.1 LacI family transcriptional regulator [Brachybacterium alimentarium]PCC38521.1 LacI family transcriptional regulator [Brachybacterium alimentarium]RCS61686.1 LacI family transcriptional regulator [Brachybacterium sp. JB7]RCS63729.1 LacI family transcriptional regulator [Brachybacterium alimentarium]RCS65420.1 LacI family transcriptional regulator [Brachybacterium alimentarium]
MKNLQNAVPRIVDVAELAGVSVSTASKALNDTGQLREDTRTRVKEAAARLGFVVGAAGRGPADTRTYTVGLLTTDSFGRFTIPLLMGVEDALAAGRMAIILCDTRDDVLRERHYLASLQERRVDGLIITGRTTDPRPSVGLQIPTVYAFSPSDDPEDHAVVADEGAGAAMAAEHLLAMGSRRIAHVTGPQRHHSADARAVSVQETLGDSLITPALFGHWSEEWGRTAVDMLLASHPDLDGLVCGSDQIARGVTDRLREKGIDVPGQVRVTGFDNWEVMALASRPPLTTVDMGLAELGRLAGRTLLDLVEGRTEPPRRQVLAPRLEVRASSL